MDKKSGSFGRSRGRAGSNNPQVASASAGRGRKTPQTVSNYFWTRMFLSCQYDIFNILLICEQKPFGIKNMDVTIL